MKLKAFLGISSIFFFAVAIIHLMRVLFNWNFVIDNYTIPEWMSIVAFVVLIYLSIMAFRFRKRL